MKKSHLNFHFSLPCDNHPLLRTDLACEIPVPHESTKGTDYEEYDLYGFLVADLTVKNEQGTALTKRKIGRYTTLQCPVMRCLSKEEKFTVTDALSDLIVSFTERSTGKQITNDTRVLITGLGNRFISADSIGSKVSDKVTATYHIKNEAPELFGVIGCSSVCVIQPGVTGQTGMDAFEIIKGTADRIRPDVIIVIDSLAARGSHRLAATIQLTDTGIEPGSGIGNRRSEISKETMGYPVISIGVPTVIDCATIVLDTLCLSGISFSEDALLPVLKEKQELFVSLRDCDVISEEVSSIIAKAIDRAFLSEGLKE